MTQRVDHDWIDDPEVREMLRRGRHRELRRSSGLFSGFLLGMALSTCSAHAQFITTGELRGWCLSENSVYQGACSSYIMGWADAEIRAGKLCLPDRTKPIAIAAGIRLIDQKWTSEAPDGLDTVVRTYGWLCKETS